MTVAARAGTVIAAALLIAAVILLASGFWSPLKSASANRIERGTASTYGKGYNGWLALPEGPGHRVEICSTHSGTKKCLVRTSNDAGPDLAMQRAGRIADLDIATFEYLCGCQWNRVGLIEVTVEYLSPGESIGRSSGTPPAARPTLPPTDTTR